MKFLELLDNVIYNAILLGYLIYGVTIYKCFDYNILDEISFLIFNDLTIEDKTLTFAILITKNNYIKIYILFDLLISYFMGKYDIKKISKIRVRAIIVLFIFNYVIKKNIFI